MMPCDKCKHYRFDVCRADSCSCACHAGARQFPPGFVTSSRDAETGRSAALFQHDAGRYYVVYDVVDADGSIDAEKFRNVTRCPVYVGDNDYTMLTDHLLWQANGGALYSTHNARRVQRGDTVTVRRANDRQVGGEAYREGGRWHDLGDFQPWDAWWRWKLNPFQAVVLKYVVRYRDKGGVEDLRKAMHYIEKLIELETAEKSPGPAAGGAAAPGASGEETQGRGPRGDR